MEGIGRLAFDGRERASLRAAPHHILDTWAEANFLNGKREEASQAIEAAIALEPDHLDYYLGQKEKFGRGVNAQKKD